MPFVSEELHANLGGTALLTTSAWPELSEVEVDEAARDEIDWVVRLVSEVRSVRSEMTVPPSATIPLTVADSSEATRERLARQKGVIEPLAKVELAIGTAPSGTVQSVFEDASLFLHVADVVDLDEQRGRLAREMAKVEDEIAKIDKKLGNEKFLARAPEAVVAEQRERRDEAEQSRHKLDRAMARLAGV